MRQYNKLANPFQERIFFSEAQFLKFAGARNKENLTSLVLRAPNSSTNTALSDIPNNNQQMRESERYVKSAAG